MSLSPAWLFVNTPIPWAAVVCMILYRHDLSQLWRPMKERCSIRDWELIFQDLGITPSHTTKTDDFVRQKGGSISLIRRFSEVLTEKYPNTSFYCFIIAIVAFSSMVVSLVSSMIFLDSRFVTLILAAAQFLCAAPLIFAMQRLFGSFPSASYKYTLKRRRMGSLLRYEEVLSRPASIDPE